LDNLDNSAAVVRVNLDSRDKKGNMDSPDRMGIRGS
jgi:hypothetical protein